MAATQPPLSSRLRFLKEGLLIPTRNPGLFAPIWALTIAEATVHIRSMNGERRTLFAAATSALTSLTAGSIVAAVATCAAVSTYASDNNCPGFNSVVADVLNTALFNSAAAAVACSAAFSVLVSLIHNLVWYTGSLLVLDVLLVVLVAAGLAQWWLSSVVLPVAIVVAASEPGCHRAAALRRAWSVTSENADQAAIFLFLTGVAFSVASPSDGSPSRYPTEVVWLCVVMSGTLRLYAVCAITAFYHECKRRSQMPHASSLQLIATGKEWLHGLPIRCLDGLKEILEGRRSIRHLLTATVDRIRRWSVWVLCFVSNHPWVAGVVVICAARLISEGPPSVFYRNGIVRYRDYLKRKHNIHPRRNCEWMA